MDRPHDGRPQDIRPLGYPKTSSQPFLAYLPTKISRSKLLNPARRRFSAPNDDPQRQADPRKSTTKPIGRFPRLGTPSARVPTAADKSDITQSIDLRDYLISRAA